MTLFSQIIQYAISGITSGSIYAVIGICWSLVYLITKVLNFTTGEFVMLGGMLTWGFRGAGFGLVPSVLFAISCTILISMILERIAIRPVRFPSEMTYMMITIAAASVIKGVVLLGWGSETRTIPAFFGTEVIHLFGATMTSQILCVLGLLVIVTLGLSLFLNRTLFGKALRASAINVTGASLMGIDISRFRFFCFGLAGGLGAITGIVITPITFTGYEVGMLTGLKGLVAAIVGGWTMTGTMVAALLLGLFEGFGAGFISAGLKDVFSLLVMILFLILRTMDLALWRGSVMR
ncbi:MAG TPA: branched-chain amino acid ABC transporter permease [Thermodesulfobacteriota bacterium]|jgi:branched-chain amino acid transport system permease protein|nr:branched-chain amino acid ABC transporter permease [Thermodesulfobacteriota bacterium]